MSWAPVLSDMCFLTLEAHMPSDMCSRLEETHFAPDLVFVTRTHGGLSVIKRSEHYFFSYYIYLLQMHSTKLNYKRYFKEKLWRRRQPKVLLHHTRDAPTN